jgi:hypothetical protein
VTLICLAGAAQKMPPSLSLPPHPMPPQEDHTHKSGKHPQHRYLLASANSESICCGQRCRPLALVSLLSLLPTTQQSSCWTEFNPPATQLSCMLPRPLLDNQLLKHTPQSSEQLLR